MPLALEVKPQVPAMLQLQLRPDQIEGFRFLGRPFHKTGSGAFSRTTWVSVKRLQVDHLVVSGCSRTLRSGAPSPLVVRPESVLDVWGR